MSVMSKVLGLSSRWIHDPTAALLLYLAEVFDRRFTSLPNRSEIFLRMARTSSMRGSSVGLFGVGFIRGILWGGAREGFGAGAVVWWASEETSERQILQESKE